MPSFAFVEEMSRASFDVAVKATVVLLVSGLATRSMAKSSAAIRHRVWSLTMVGLIVLPILSCWLPSWQWAVLPAASSANALRITLGFCVMERTFRESGPGFNQIRAAFPPGKFLRGVSHSSPGKTSAPPLVAIIAQRQIQPNRAPVWQERGADFPVCQ